MHGEQPKQLIASVLDAAPMVFALLDGNGGLMLSNQAYHSMARELSNDNPAHALMDTLCPDWRAQLASDPAHCTFTDQEARLDRPGGAPRWYTCSAQLIRLSNEAVDGFLRAKRRWPAADLHRHHRAARRAGARAPPR